MKRLATLVLAASLSLGALVTTGQGASATPFSDVPANHWAYQAIQSLAADGLVEGYPDGRFKGDRPLSRYEMAVIVARVVAKLQANGANYASKADLDKLQKLMDALKDELDALGVRVTNLEDALDALDKRTKLAQSLQLHGAMIERTTARQRLVFPKTVAGGGIDAFTNAFLTTPDSNNPLEQTGAGNQFNVDDKITLSYTINENLTVALPVHIMSYEWGGEFSNQAKYSVNPDIVVNIAKSGNLTGMYLRLGRLDNMKSSRTGLTFRAPDATQQGPGYEIPVQPYQQGFQIGGVLNGLTEFQFQYSRLDPTQIYTATNVLDPTGESNLNAFTFTTLRPQTGYLQQGYPNAPSGALKTDTYNAGSGSLSSVYLNSKAVAGTVFVSFYNGCTYNNAGQLTNGSTAGCAATSPVNFVYNDTQNQVVFQRPLPAGSVVGVTYVGLAGVKDTQPEYYEWNARINHKIKGLTGAELGLSFNRIYSLDDSVCNNPTGTTATTNLCSAPGVNGVGASAGSSSPNYGVGLVSDTVLGVDGQVPLWFLQVGGDKTQRPVLYGEASFSKYTPDYRSTSAITDSAGILGVRLKIFNATGSLQYQRVGANYFSGAPFRYFGPAPQLFSFWKAGFFPAFYGLANNLGINQTFDNFAGLTGGARTQVNPNLTFVYPVFNPFIATGPQYFSAFAPNTQGFTLNINTPITLGDRKINGSLVAQNLQEIQPNGFGPLVYSQVGYPQTGIAAGAGNASSVRMNFTRVQGNLQFAVPAFGQNLAVNLTGAVERLLRNDKTAANGYVPVNVATQTVDPAAAAAASAAGLSAANPGPAFYPNYVNMYHTTAAAGVTIPVTANVSLGGVYNTQRFYGSYGTTLSQNIDNRKDIYSLTATYNIPKTTSSVAFLYRNQQYKDNVLPSYNFSQNREDVNFTIRF